MAYYLAIDPGRDKFGVAVVDESGAAIRLDAVAIEQLEVSLAALAAKYSFAHILLGDGTGKKKFASAIAKIFPDVDLVIVNEYNTTFLAKKLYWQMNPPQGWRKFLPLALLTIPQPVDAYAALVIARRWLDENRER